METIKSGKGVDLKSKSYAHKVVRQGFFHVPFYKFDVEKIPCNDWLSSQSYFLLPVKLTPF